MKRKLTKGVCRECGCTQLRACVDDYGDTCCWQDKIETLCSHCADPAYHPKDLPRDQLGYPIYTEEPAP